MVGKPNGYRRDSYRLFLAKNKISTRRPCIIRQTLDTTRLSTNDEKLHRKILVQVMSFLIDSIRNNPSNETLTPPHIGRHVYKIIREITGCKDPYHDIKVKYNKIALKMYLKLKEIVKNSPDPLLTAIRLSIAGNIIDFGAGTQFDLNATLKEVLIKEFAIFHYDFFCESLNKTKTLLYLGDNAGEIVFDKILIEEVKKLHKVKVYYAVKSIPVINDVTIEDTNEVKMNDVAEIIPNGSDAPGTILDLCSKKFLKIYNSAQMIISKGQGNYETLNEENKKNTFFLLKVKCPLVAEHLEIKVGDIILKKGAKK
ncbi:MAG: ARMT1-like domain-containing protein [Elusimicrobiota bacterium]